MKFIIFICNNIRQGQFPRLPDFPFCQDRQQYLYLGRELTADEFNAACERVFDPKYNSKGYNFRPVAIVEQPPAPVEPTLPDKPPVSDRIAKMNEARAAKKNQPTPLP